MAAEAPNPTEYIAHHLTFLTNHKPHGLLDLSVVNFDSVFFSILLAVVFGGTFIFAARRATSGAPGKLQTFVEVLVSQVDEQVRGIFQGHDRLIAPLALTIFCWIFLFNVMDILPIDLLPGAAGAAGLAHLRIVPSIDLNVVFALSLTVFVLIIVYSIKMKGLGGFLGELSMHPFPPSGKQANILLRIICIPLNLVMELPTFVARPVSLALRLYGNMYAGEMVFVLIALLTLTSGFAALSSVGGWVYIVLSVLAGLAWTVFDLFIGLLQAFIFMMLTIVYLSQASEHH
ncbi:MAG TPA: F0F1 ATP synthase subunit A [Steroidobacteraceae bacterium]